MMARAASVGDSIIMGENMPPSRPEHITRGTRAHADV